MSLARNEINHNKLIFTDEQTKLVFRQFIEKLVSDTNYLSILIPEHFWEKKLDNAYRQKLSQLGRTYSPSKYQTRPNKLHISWSEISLNLYPTDKKATIEDIETLFINHPQLLCGQSLLVSTQQRLICFENYFHNWAVETPERAKIICDHPTLYLYSKENKDRGKYQTALARAPIPGIFIGIFILLAIVIGALGGVGAAILLGCAALVLTAWMCYDLHRVAKESKLTPLSDKAAELAKKPSVKFANLNLLQVSLELNDGKDANENPVNVIIKPGPFFQPSSSIVKTSELEVKEAPQLRS